MDIILKIIPKSRFGKWSFALAIMFVIGLVLALILSDNTIFDQQYNQTIAVPVTITLILLSGASVITGLISMIRHQERSALVILGIAASVWFGLVTLGAHVFME